MHMDFIAVIVRKCMLKQFWPVLLLLETEKVANFHRHSVLYYMYSLRNAIWIGKKKKQKKVRDRGRIGLVKDTD